MYFLIYTLGSIFSYFFTFIYFIYYLLSKNTVIKANRLVLKIKKTSYPSIWLHCASVGEFISASELIKQLQKKYQKCKIVITSHTKTSRSIIHKYFQDTVYHYFLPIDNAYLIKKFLNIIKPKIVIWVEQDFFPITLSTIKKNRIPLILLNARMSDKSFARWNKLKFILKHMLKAFTIIYPASLEDKKKYKTFFNGEIKYIGNLKYTTIQSPIFFKPNTKLDNFIKNKNVFVALSTHNNEEVACLKSHLDANKSLKDLVTFVIPRHPHRLSNIMSQIENNKDLNKLKIITYSDFLKSPRKFDALVVDTIGVVDIFLHFADIVFVGKSLYKKNCGGHNILEPLKYGCVVIFGPYMSNFKSLVNECITNGAGIMVHSPSDITDTIVDLFSKPKKLNEIKSKSSYIFKNNDKIIKQTMKEISKYI